MTALRTIVLVVVLGALIWPEAARWRAEHVVRDVTARFRALAQAPKGPDSTRALDDVTMRALAAGAAPGDQRPVIVAASAQLLAGAPARALSLYRDALALGERAEIDLNLARAHALLGDVPSAEAALLRMAWVSPVLLEQMNAAARERIGAEVARLETDLRNGVLSEPPPPPR